MMNRQEILESAIQCVCTDREKQYGNPENSFAKIARLWSDYLGGINISEVDVAIMMTLLKIARIMGGRFKADSFVDACGYLACAGEIALKDFKT